MHKDILKLKLNDELDLLSQIWGKEIEERVYESRQGKLEIFPNGYFYVGYRLPLEEMKVREY